MEQNTAHESMSRSRFPDGFRYMRGKQEYVTYRERSTVRVWYSEEPSYYEGHYHSAVEIIMPVKGEVTYSLLDGTYRVQVGEVLIVPPNCIHDLDMKSGSARYLLLFEPDGIFGMRDMQMVAAMLKMPIYLTGQPDLQETVRRLLLQVISCYDQQEPLWNSLCYALLLQMYATLGKHYMIRARQSEEEANRDIDSDIINSARLYIDQNCMLNLTLNDMASFSGFSKYYFSRVFKQQLGIPFSEYLRRKRVSLAEELLIHSRQPIQEIAATAGFGSIATFNRVFRDVKSCTPSRYREIYGDIQ